MAFTVTLNFTKGGQFTYTPEGDGTCHRVSRGTISFSEIGPFQWVEIDGKRFQVDSITFKEDGIDPSTGEPYPQGQ